MLIYQLVSAIIIGGVIGLERKSRKKPAGLITNILVCLGATIIAIEQNILVEKALMLVKEDPLLVDAVKIDMGRLTAQIISGIGFLGGGVIMQSKGSIKGITTAATLWVVAVIGISIGSGRVVEGYIYGSVVLCVLTLIKKWEVIAIDKRKIRSLYIEFLDSEENEVRLKETLKMMSIKVIRKNTKSKENNGEEVLVKREYILNMPSYIGTKRIVELLSANEKVIKINKID